MDKIDFVIAWVDPGDKAWQASRQRFSEGYDAEANSNSRFRDMDTLKYVFRGIEKFAPWVNRVHFVTAGHLPGWLDIYNPKINVVKHGDIFSSNELLPVFNSSAIEINFHKIDRISQQFVIFNDDFLLLDDVAPEDFFVNGLPVDFLIDDFFRGLAVRFLKSRNSWLANLSNAIDLVNSKFYKRDYLKNGARGYYASSYGCLAIINNWVSSWSDKFQFFSTYHHPQPHLKSIWESTWESFFEVLKNTETHRFRHQDDVTQYLFRYMHLASGNFHARKRNNYKTFNIGSEIEARRCLEVMENYTHVCINDVPWLSDCEFDLVKSLISEQLSKIFPNKCSYEK